MSIKGNTVGHPLPDPRKGMDMTGPINMNGQAIKGLDAPTADDQAVNWGSVKNAYGIGENGPVPVKDGGTGAGDTKTAKENLEIKDYRENLLINSNLTNPVNQRGEDILASAVVGYKLDHWKQNTGATSLELTSLGVKIINTKAPNGAFSLCQTIDNPGRFVNKPLTVALKVIDVTSTDGTYNHCFVGSIDGVRAYTDSIKGPGIYIAVLQPQSELADLNVCIRQIGASTNGTNTLTVEWIALYEGAYTLATLPEYQPKGYGVEVVNCNNGAIAIEKLWENASPTSDFAAQTVNLDLKGYTHIIIEYCLFATTIPSYRSLTLKIGKRGSLGGAHGFTRWREFTSSASGVSFSEGNYNSSYGSDDTVNNAVCMPSEIYGIKGVST